MRSAVVASLVSVAAASSGWGPGSQGPPAGGPPAGGPPAYGPPGGSWGPGSENGGDSWTTEVVSQFTTFCPEATQITHGGQTYTATSATTFTITHCPGGCTISYPTTWATTSAPAETSAVETSAVASTPAVTSAAETTPVAPSTWAESSAVAPTTWATTSTPAAVTPYPVSNGTSSAAPAVGSTASAYPTGVVPATGGAAQLSAAGAAIAAVFGLVAAL